MNTAAIETDAPDYESGAFNVAFIVMASYTVAAVNWH